MYFTNIKGPCLRQWINLELIKIGYLKYYIWFFNTEPKLKKNTRVYDIYDVKTIARLFPPAFFKGLVG